MGDLLQAFLQVSLSFAIAVASYLFMKNSRLAVRLKYWYNRISKNSFTPKNKKIFYQYFSTCIDNSSISITHTGDGFNFNNPDSLRNANILDAAFCRALDRGVRVQRYQIISTMTINWLSRLYHMKNKYQDLFRIYVNNDHESIGSICIIDAGRRTTVFENQILQPDPHGGTLPLGWNFKHGDYKLADGFVEVFDNIIRDPKTIELDLKGIKILQRKLWDGRLKNAIDDPKSKIIDAEIRDALRNMGNIIAEYTESAFYKNEYDIPGCEK